VSLKLDDENTLGAAGAGSPALAGVPVRQQIDSGRRRHTPAVALASEHVAQPSAAATPTNATNATLIFENLCASCGR
jgi:hypothetical protein